MANTIPTRISAAWVSAAWVSSATARPDDAAQWSSSASVTAAPLSASRVLASCHCIRRDQSAHDGVRSRQRPRHCFVIAIKLGLIVGQDHDRPPRFLTSVAPDVVGCVQHAARYVGASVESFVAEEPVKRALHILLVSR